MTESVIEMVEGDDGVFRPKEKASPGLWIAGGVAAAGLVGLGAYLWHRRASAAEAGTDGSTGELPVSTDGASTNGTGGGAPAMNTGQWTNAVPLPTAADVAGFELVKNWGKTPTDLRPLFAKMELVSGIKGSAWIFAVISKRESVGFNASAHNDSSAERTASRNAYKNAKGNNPALKYGDQAAEFGSGGLFGALAPYFLWTGVQEMGAKAPLLGSPPEIMFLPRVAAFGACVYLQRLLGNYRIDDHADIKVGWANPSLLKSGRGNNTYVGVRTRFLSDAKELGVDLEDTSTIPATLSAAAWPGVAKVFDQLVGTLPTPRGK